LNKIAMSGAWSDPLAALVLCTPWKQRTQFVMEI